MWRSRAIYFFTERVNDRSSGLDESGAEHTGQSVMMMKVTAKPEHRWQFILAAIVYTSDEDLRRMEPLPINGSFLCSRGPYQGN